MPAVVKALIQAKGAGPHARGERLLRASSASSVTDDASAYESYVRRAGAHRRRRFSGLRCGAARGHAYAGYRPVQAGGRPSPMRP